MKIGRIVCCGVLAVTIAGASPGAVRNAPGDAFDSATTTSWSLSVVASVGGLSDSLATLGVRPDATPLYDASYDVPHPPNPPGDYVEAYFPHTGGNWPTLLGTRFASDLTSPASPRWILNIETSLPSGTVSLHWDTTLISGLPDGYEIMMKDSATGDSVSIRKGGSYSFAYTGPRAFVFWAEYDATVTAVDEGWNLVSVPRIVPDYSKSVLFPTAISAAFAYEGGYKVVSDLENGKGYWVKFDASAVFLVAGGGITSMTVPVNQGWNIIGSVDDTVAAPSGGVVVSNVFGYNGGYVTVSQLVPGRGYWVKAGSAGTVGLGTGAQEMSAISRSAGPSFTLAVTDAAGGSMHLRLEPGRLTEIKPGRFDLPPPPPEGAFDVRFVSQRWMEYYQSDGTTESEFRVLLQSMHYPLTITCTGNDPTMRLAIEDPAGMGGVRKVPGGPPDRWTIERAAVRNVRIRLTPVADVPGGFVLEPGYPNPFNPSTTVGYSISEASLVRVTLHDILGREAVVIAENREEAGRHQLTINAGELELSSGVYVVRVTATGFSSGRTAAGTEKILYAK